VGKGFIHVHHINQISEIGREYEIDPIKDLIPVCPNCHSMIHSKRPAFTIDEINEIRKNYL
jgi:5-methylcytosine-specific restriction protein A